MERPVDKTALHKKRRTKALMALGVLAVSWTAIFFIIPGVERWFIFIPALAIFSGRAIYLLVRNNNRNAALRRWAMTNPERAKSYQKQDDAMEDLRNMAFKTSPQQLNLELTDDHTKVYGVIMDLGMGSGTATIVAYQTGDASLYISTGGGILGGGQHENVSKAAKQLVTISQNYLAQANKTETTPVPAAGHVIFYLLTNTGIYTCGEEIKRIEGGQSPWAQLFYEGNKVLTELRRSTENRN